MSVLQVKSPGSHLQRAVAPMQPEPTLGAGLPGEDRIAPEAPALCSPSPIVLAAPPQQTVHTTYD